MALRVDLVFCPPPEGKPDRKQTWDPNSNVARPRVRQAKENGALNDWYYALNRIRQRIGPHPHSTQISQRCDEKLFSLVRKKITSLNAEIDWNLSFTKKLIQVRGDISREIAKNILLDQDLPGLQPSAKAKGTSLLKAFCEQREHKHIAAYLDHDEPMRVDQLYQEALKQMGIELDFISNEKIPNLVSIVYKRYLFLRQAVDRYKLFISSWTPDPASTKTVRKELQDHGPQVVFGQFGKKFYNDKPFKLTKPVAGKEIWGWRSNATRSLFSTTLSRHAVVLVGASEKHVYYLDPADSEQIFYILTYAKFLQYLQPLCAPEEVSDQMGPKRYTIYNPAYPNCYR